MKSTHKSGLLLGICGCLLMIINYVIHQYAFIFVGTVMLFIGIMIPIFLEDKTIKSDRREKL